MDNATYTVLTRQSGLAQEMQVVANNLANTSTTGFRREGLIFSEFVHAMDSDNPSLSMTRVNAHRTDLGQGGLSQTGGTFDLGIEGAGFFLVETPQGNRLTRAGGFTPNEAGELVTFDGNRLLDAGGAPVFVPQNAKSVAIAADGTVSADGVPVSQIGLYMPEDPLDLARQSGVMFRAENGVVPVESGRILQGFVEASNVNPIDELTRMIQVQRAYEMGQKLLDQEHERIKNAIQTLTR